MTAKEQYHIPGDYVCVCVGVYTGLSNPHCVPLITNKFNPNGLTGFTNNITCTRVVPEQDVTALQSVVFLSVFLFRTQSAQNLLD